MKKTLDHQSTLIQYDQVQLAIAIDEVDTQYICLLVDDGLPHTYCCVAISRRRLSSLLTNKIDLLSIFNDKETDNWFKAFTEDFEAGIDGLEMCGGEIPQDYWPEPGLFVSPPVVGEDLLISAIERQNLVSELTIEPQGAAYHAVSAKTLSLILNAFQSLVGRALTAVQRTHQLNPAPSQPTLDVYAFAPGSFKIRFESRPKIQTDLFNPNSEMQAAFELIESILRNSANLEVATSILEKNKGHFVSRFINFLKVIESEQTYLSFAWAQHDGRDVHQAGISFASISPLLKVLEAREEIRCVRVTLTGVLKKADVGKGTWRLKSDEDQNEYSGRSKGESDLLSGLKIDSRYSVACEEYIEDVPFSAKEVKNLHALSFSAV
jgi:hypothetical protein